MGDSAVLGLSANSCAAAAALVVDGTIVAVRAERRFSHLRNDRSLPVRAVEACLAAGGLDASQVDVVAYHEKPLVDASRLLATWQRRGPRGVGDFAAGVAGRYGDDLMVRYRIERMISQLGGDRHTEVVFGEHLVSLASAAFLPSPFDSAAILVVGDGGWGTSALGTGSHHRIDLLAEQTYPDSPTSLWSLIAGWCGFDGTEVDGVSALAARGEPVYSEQLGELALLQEDGSVQVDGRRVRWWDPRPPAALRHLLGPPRRDDEPLEQRHADLARSVQDLVGSAMVAMARHARQRTGAHQLCLGGDLARDEVVAGRVRQEAGFDEVWIEPQPCGQAAATGAALWYWHGDLGRGRGQLRPDGHATEVAVPMARHPEAETTSIADAGIDGRRRRRRGAVATIGRAAGAVVGLFAVLLPWFVHRLLHLDPLRRRGGPGWVDLGRLHVEPSKQWNRGAAPNRATTFQRVRWALAAPLCVLLVVGSVVAAGWLSTSTDRPAPPAAVGNAPWWNDYVDELHWAFNRPGGAANPYEFPPLHDIRGRYVNVVDGDRVSWRPPECNCRRMRVWVYGGSTALGWGQRDDHTIPSELARTAWEQDGIALDVENKGIPGYLGWQGAQRFAWDLATRPAPDLVVFYEGYNDLRAAVRTNDDDQGGVSEVWPTTWNRKNLLAETAERNRIVQRLFGRPPEGARRRTTASPPHLGPSQLGALAADKYARGRQAAIDTAAVAGVPVAWFWQPHQATRPLHEEEQPPDTAVARSLRRADRAARRALPPDVHDLGDVFDSVDGPIYWDDVHTGERGARLVAESIYSVVEPQVRAAATGEP